MNLQSNRFLGNLKKENLLSMSQNNLLIDNIFFATKITLNI